MNRPALRSVPPPLLEISAKDDDVGDAIDDLKAPGEHPGSVGARPRNAGQLPPEALQAAILKSTSFYKIATDQEGLICVFNAGAERLFGYSATDMLHRAQLAELVDLAELTRRAQALSEESGLTIAASFEALAHRARNDVEDNFELSYRCKSGELLATRVSVTVLRDARGGIAGYLFMGSDNTARKQVEADQQRLDQQLRDQQFYSRSLIESIIDALVTIDPAGTITDVNEQTTAFIGRSREQLIGSAFNDHFTEPELAQDCVARVLAGQRVANYELTAIASDGRLTPVSCNATPFHDRDGKLCGVIVAARDITERQGQDRALSQTARELQHAKVIAESANLAKSEFLSNMSHELRSPLNAILGFAQLIDTGAPAPTPAQKDSVDQILKAGWYLLDLINEVLDLAMIESGKLSISPEPLALAELLADCLAMVEPHATSSDIRVAIVPPLEALYVRADRTRAKQVFVNLLSNAIKYNRSGGEVQVSWAPSGSSHVRVSVRDTGAGLAADKLVHLFESFNRLGREGGAEEGTGIGLVVSKRLVEMMGGEIGVSSTVGVGSTFWVDLNTCDAAEMSAAAQAFAPQAAVAPGEAAEHVVLCVEDNPANLSLLERLLSRRTDVRLVTAKDGRSGIDMARALQPAVILMDINLPGMSGITARRLLAEDAATARIPVIAISANAMPRDIEKGLAAGFFHYLTKPIRIDEFMSTLDLALALSLEQSAAVASSMGTATVPGPALAPAPAPAHALASTPATASDTP